MEGVLHFCPFRISASTEFLSQEYTTLSWIHVYIFGERVGALDCVQAEKADREHAGEISPPEI